MTINNQENSSPLNRIQHYHTSMS